VKGPLDLQKRHFALNEIESHGYFRFVQWVESIDSTNKALQSWVRNGKIPFPALLVADRQTAGVGRGSNSWWSPSGCLMFSMAIPLSPGSEQADWHIDQPSHDSGVAVRLETRIWQLPLRVGFTVAESIEAIVGKRAMVKWPNDVYVDGRKISGVLIEVVSAQDSQSKQAVAIIGIGINCQVDFAGAPSELASSATSVHQWASHGMIELTTPESVLSEFVNCWLQQEVRDAAHPNWLSELWSARSFLDGKWVEVQQTTSKVQGICRGISQQGGLLLEDAKRQTVEILAGSVIRYQDL
jgi:BirA family biotin operon repressor/biotin-[acetyl-CoA-carboxylase] ligase